MAKIGLWKLIAYSVLMLVCRLSGNSLHDSSPLLGFISTIGYVGILYEVWFGSVAYCHPTRRSDPAKAFSALAWFVFVGWAIYPIGYMAMDTGWLASELSRQLPWTSFTTLAMLSARLV